MAHPVPEPRPQLSWTGPLTAEQVQAVRRLVALATEADGVAPLSEHVLLHLAAGGDPEATNLLLTVGGELAGYAHLDETDSVAGASAELVVAPGHRRAGLGHTAVELLAARSSGPLRLWAHGQRAEAHALAQGAGFTRTRVLWQLRRSLLAPLPQPVFPSDVRLRTFVVGQDEQAWVACNAAAFAQHPEQGQWTVADLRRREAEPWFDPDGFFLAERGGALAGFHWTKVHGGGLQNGHAHPPIGEVYVVGVDPAQQGGGLGQALTVQGLQYLRGRGLSQVLLYVDDDNSRAMGLYERLGFTRWDCDVTYSRG